MSLRKFKRAILASSVAALVLSPHLHAEDLNSDSIIRQLLPKDPTPSTPLLGPTPVDVGTLTSADVLTRLSPGEGRSLGATTQHPASVRLVDGREADTLASIQAFPSMQIAVAFQGSSDALAPDSTVLISVLGQALRSQKLASSKILIGVQTNALGSGCLQPQSVAASREGDHRSARRSSRNRQGTAVRGRLRPRGRSLVHGCRTPGARACRQSGKRIGDDRIPLDAL